MHTGFIKPNYGFGGFAGLPRAILGLLGGDPGTFAVPDFQKEYDNVILFFIDGFGWRFLDIFTSHPYLDRFSRDGRIVKLTSQFPSTTSAHATCIHTGLAVGQSGIFEWNYYEPRLDAMITPLLFSFTGTVERDQLKTTGIAPKQLYPSRSLYHELKKISVHSTIFQHREYTPSTYSDFLFRGADVRAYKSLDLAGQRALADGGNHGVRALINGITATSILSFSQQGDGVFRPAVDLFVALLAAVAAHFRHRHAFGAHALKRGADGIELVRIDDGDDQLHGALLG